MESEKANTKMCCINCFEDELLKRFIYNNGIKGTCGFCLSASTLCIAPENLSKMFQRFFEIYEETELNVHYYKHQEKWEHGSPLLELIQEDWNIFSDILDYEKQTDLLMGIILSLFEYGYDIGRDTLFSNSRYVATLESINEEWEEFCENIKYNNRFSVSENWENTFKGELINYISPMHSRKTLYRARIGSKQLENGEIFAYDKNAMGKPPKGMPKSGRANPEGISYLYLATDEKTAISEVRPWRSAKVSVATFSVKQDSFIIDFTKTVFGSSLFAIENLIESIYASYLFSKINHELSKPVDPNKSNLDYLPTQYLVELVKKSGFSGIIFNSALSEGKNYVLFEDKGVVCEAVTLYEVDKIEYGFELASSRASKFDF